LWRRPRPKLGCGAKERKKKVIMCCFFNWAPCYEGILEIGERYGSTHSRTLLLDGGEYSASRPGRFTARETAPVTHWIRGWLGPGTGLDAAVKRNIHSPYRDSKPRSSRS
jgi:hypothetical protein